MNESTELTVTDRKTKLMDEIGWREQIRKESLTEEVIELIRLLEHAGDFPIHGSLLPINERENDYTKVLLREDVLSGAKSDQLNVVLDTISEWLAVEILLTFPDLMEYFVIADYDDKKIRGKPDDESEEQRYQIARNFFAEMESAIHFDDYLTDSPHRKKDELYSVHRLYEYFAEQTVALKNDIREKLVDPSVSIKESFLDAGNTFLKRMLMRNTQLILKEHSGNGRHKRLDYRESQYIIDFLYYLRHAFGVVSSHKAETEGVDICLNIEKMKRAIEIDGQLVGSPAPMVVGETREVVIEFLMSEGWWPFGDREQFSLFFLSYSPGDVLLTDVIELSENSEDSTIDVTNYQDDQEEDSYSPEPITNRITLNRYKYSGKVRLKIKAIKPTVQPVEVVIDLINGYGVPFASESIQGLTVLAP